MAEQKQNAVPSKGNDRAVTKTKAVIISPEKFDAVLFDMDGVVTKTAIVHTAAWKHCFDAFLEQRFGADFHPFTEQDYLRYVDGKAREDGIRSFLSSRNIQLPDGNPQDAAGFESVNALGKLKNAKFLELLQGRGVEAYETTVSLIRSLKTAGIRIAVVTASKNGEQILRAANLGHIFDTRVDGVDAERLGLPGKPNPDLFLEAARRLGVSPERAVVVEDAAAGVEAGHRGHFGLVIGVDRDNNSQLLKDHGADTVVHDLAEVVVSGEPTRTSPGMTLAELNVTDKNWVLVYENYEPSLEGRREALCALGNGYFCTRAAAPESHDDGTHYPGTYLAGGYNRLEHDVQNNAFEEEQLVNFPNWLPVSFKIDDGDWFSLPEVELLKYQQRLDLREGVVHRQLIIRDKAGRETTIRQRWLVHMRQPHLAAIESSWTANNWSGRLTIRTALDGTVVNNGVRTGPSINKKHLQPLQSVVENDLLFLKVIASQSRLVVAEAARNIVLRDGKEIDPARSNIIQPQYVGQDIAVDVQQGETITLDKTIALYSSRDYGISEPGEAARKAVAEADVFIPLMNDQIEAWRSLWRQFDLFVETTEAHSKTIPSLLLHLNSFHTLQTASPNSIDLDMGVPARGWTGEGYQGHIFWDDLFVFPFLNLRMPNITQSLLKYRYRRLGAARKIAAAMGARGARFPWQSGADGSEQTPMFWWDYDKDAWVADHSAMEIHVDAAIAYNIWQYYQVTADLDFMHDYGAEMLFEIARFFATFAKYNDKRDRYEIHRVVGPDEFHTKYPGAKEPGINNNAYTNIMAVWTLARALDLLKIIPSDHKEQICDRLKITQEEIALWDRVSRKMFVPFLDDGVIAQFEGYDQLEDFPWCSDDTVDVGQLNRVLKETSGTPNQYKVCKQADVLMLFYVFSYNELHQLFHRLDYPFKPSDIKENIEYYMPKTANNSSLSRVAHGWVLSRLDRLGSWKLLTRTDCGNFSNHRHYVPEPRPWDVFLEALVNDYFDVHHGTTREGIHMGAMAGTIDIVQRCYTGMVMADDVLWLSPRLPDALNRLSFSLHYRDQALQFDITQKSMKITARHSSARPIKIGFKGKVYEFNAGDSKTFDLQLIDIVGHQADNRNAA